MEKLLEALKAANLDVPADLDDKQILAVAKAMGIDPDDHMDRVVEVVDYTNKRKETNKFVKTPSFVVGVNEKGKKIKVQGLFLRVDALDQAIEDLINARELIQQG